MRISRPLDDEIPAGEGEVAKVVEDHARCLSESFFRWADDGPAEDVETSSVLEGILWMK